MDAITGHFKYFESQEADENVLIITRKHWTTLVAPFIIGLFILLFFIILYIFFNNSLLDITGLPVNLVESILALIILFLVSYIYTSWLMRYYNVVILTDEHLVEVEQIALFSRKVSVLDLDHIEDASFGQHGMLETFLDFGDLEIQTAGEIRNFIFKSIKDPDMLQKKIMELKELEENERKSIIINKKNKDFQIGNRKDLPSKNLAAEAMTPSQSAPVTKNENIIDPEKELGEEENKINITPPNDLDI